MKDEHDPEYNIDLDELEEEKTKEWFAVGLVVAFIVLCLFLIQYLSTY